MPFEFDKLDEKLGDMIDSCSFGSRAEMADAFGITPKQYSNLVQQFDTGGPYTSLKEMHNGFNTEGGTDRKVTISESQYFKALFLLLAHKYKCIKYYDEKTFQSRKAKKLKRSMATRRKFERDISKMSKMSVSQRKQFLQTAVERARQQREQYRRQQRR